MNPWSSPFIVPVAACAVGAVAIITGIWSQTRNNEIRSQERLALLARGVPIAEIERILRVSAPASSRSPRRGLTTSRRAAVILLSTGIGLVAFFVVLALILHQRDIYSGAAIGLIPIAIGLGFVVDYQLQKREFAHYGLSTGRDL